jgi:hypothetical protein
VIHCTNIGQSQGCPEGHLGILPPCVTCEFVEFDFENQNEQGLEWLFSAFLLLPAPHYHIYAFASMDTRVHEKQSENVQEPSTPLPDRDSTMVDPTAPQGKSFCRTPNIEISGIFRSTVPKAQYIRSSTNACNPRFHDFGRNHRRICTSCPRSF